MDQAKEVDMGSWEVFCTTGQSRRHASAWGIESDGERLSIG